MTPKKIDYWQLLGWFIFGFTSLFVVSCQTGQISFVVGDVAHETKNSCLFWHGKVVEGFGPFESCLLENSEGMR
jgi:hypothetical protein